jgi:hypothetical protein
MHMSHNPHADWLSLASHAVAPRCSPASPSHLEPINPGRARRTRPASFSESRARLIWLVS